MITKRMFDEIEEYREKVLFYENNMELSFREKYVTITKEIFELCEEYKKNVETLDDRFPDKLEKGKRIALKVVILQSSLARLCDKNGRHEIAEELMKPLIEFMEG